MKLNDKYKNMSIQSKAALWFTVCSLLQNGISFITGPIFARLMDTEQYGRYSLYLSWYQIMTIITTLYLSAGIFNNAMNKFSDDKDSYLSSMQGITICITLICLSIYILFKDFWNVVFGLNTHFMLLMFVELFITPALTFWSAKQRYIYKYKSLVIITLLIAVITSVSGVFAVYYFVQKDFARLICVIVVKLGFCGVLLINNFIKGKRFYDRNYWKYALGMAMPLLPHYLSGVILNQGDRVVISKICGNSDVALYSVAYTIGMLVQIFTNAIGNSLTPWIYENINKNSYQSMQKKLNRVLLMFYLIAFGLMLFSPEILLIFGDKYTDAVYIIPPVAASTFFIYLYSLISSLQFYYEKTKFMMYASISSAILNILLNIIFIPKFGFVAAGYTTLICYSLYCLGHHYVSSKIATKKNNGNNVYDKKFVLLMSCIVWFTCIFISLILKYTVIRYSIILLIFIVLIFSRKKILGIINDVVYHE